MPKRSLECFVLDILLSIDRIKRFSKRLICVDDFVQDEIAVGVILRDFSVIGEAMNYVLQAKKYHQFIKPQWRNIVDFRNIVIHDYFGLSYGEVFEIIKHDVPDLEKELHQFLINLHNQIDLSLVVQDTKDELTAMGRKHSLKYITKLEKLLNIK